MTSFLVKTITHLDDDVEGVLTSLSLLDEMVIKPRGIEDSCERTKVRQKMLQLICTERATQTLQEAAKVVRQHVYNEVLVDQVVADETAFIDFLEQEFEDLDEEFEDTLEYSQHLFQMYKRELWNQLNSIVFGQDTYRAYKQQKDYLMNKILKPFGVSVEATFCRIKTLTSLLSYFPPPSSMEKTATAKQWEAFKEQKKVSNKDKREMK